MDWKLELVVVPVSDVDRANAFYTRKVDPDPDRDASPECAEPSTRCGAWKDAVQAGMPLARRTRASRRHGANGVSIQRPFRRPIARREPPLEGASARRVWAHRTERGLGTLPEIAGRRRSHQDVVNLSA